MSPAVGEAIISPANDVLVSVVSSWEISIRYGLGKLPLPLPPDRYLPIQRRNAGFDLLPIDEPEVCQVHRLPALHRDPFDRLLVAQANSHGLVLATNDPVVEQYPVRTLW